MELSKEEWKEWLTQHPTSEALKKLEELQEDRHFDFSKCSTWDEHQKIKGEIDGIGQAIDFLRTLPL